MKTKLRGRITLNNQIVKLAWSEKESNWMKVIFMANMMQSNPLAIRDDKWAPHCTDTRCWAAIASKDDHTTALEIMHGFEKCAPEF